MTPVTQKDPRLHSVAIQVKERGFSYTTPDDRNAVAIKVRKGDHVKWNSDHGNFSVLFKANSPFADIAFHGRKGANTVTATVVGEPGSYFYAVTVALPDGGLIVDDPEIIVGD
jgi:hypothetical protein